MGTICLQCGDKGFPNAFVYCVNCLEFAVHRYCLDELPATFDEFVYWVCDDCKVEVPQQFGSLNSEPIQMENGDNVNLKHVKPNLKEKSSKRRETGDDCEVEVPQQFGSLNSEPTQLENGDYVNLKHVKPSLKEKSSKRRKTGDMLLDIADNICEDIPSKQSYKVTAETNLTESALLAGDCSPLEVRACSGASPIAEKEEHIAPRSSSLELDDMNNDLGSQQLQSPDDVLLRNMRTKKKIKKKVKKKVKKKSSRELSSEMSMQKLENIPQEKSAQAHDDNSLNDHNDSAKLVKKGASPLEAEENKKHKKKIKTKKNEESARNFLVSEDFVHTIGDSFSEQPSDSYTKNNLNECMESTDLEKKNDSLLDAKMGHSGHSSLELDDMNNDLGSQQLQSPDDVLLRNMRTKKKVKKKSSRELSSEIFMQKLDSPQEKCAQAQDDNSLNDHNDSAKLVKKGASPLEAEENKKHKKKIKTKKNEESARNFLVSEDFVHTIGDSFSEQPSDSYTKNNSNECMESTDLEKKNDSLLDAKMGHSGHSSLELDDMNNDLGSQQLQSPDDVLLRNMRTKKKIKKKVKKKSSRELSSEMFMQKLENSPQEKSAQAHDDNSLNDHNDSAKLVKKRASSLEAEENKKHKKKIKTKKNEESARNFLVSEDFVHTIGDSFSEEPCDSYTKNNLNECMESTDLEKKNDSILDATMEHSGHSSLELDDMNNDLGSQQLQSPDDVLLRNMRTKKKIKKKVKKKSSRELSSEMFMQKLENSPQEKSAQAHDDNSLNDHNDSAKLVNKRASPLEAEENKKHKKKIKTKKNKESARNFLVSEDFVHTIGDSFSEEPCDSYTKNNLNECMDLEKKNDSLLDAKMEHSGHQSCDVNAELEVTVTGNQVVEFSPLNKTNKKKSVVNTSSTDLQGLIPLETGVRPDHPSNDATVTSSTDLQGLIPLETGVRPDHPSNNATVTSSTDLQGLIPLETGVRPDHPSNNATVDHYELAHPLVDPIWRGSFNILNREYREYDELEGMVAHLSQRACQKAYEESILFPTILDLEIHPKSNVWPKSFLISEPSGDSIALYFFPAHQRSERIFSRLVEQMMNGELAMRAILENAELLVFTSRELPLSYWRFQGNHYLWGVFRGKRPLPVDEDAGK